MKDNGFTMNSSGKSFNRLRSFTWHQAMYVVAAIWICSVIAGIVLLAKYGSAPGAAAGPPRSWPATPGLPCQSSRPSLVMFVHPKCPCSRASINELARLTARCRDRMDLTAIPGLRVVVDQGGRLAAAFGITTSGHCLVYDAGENLIFSGGITTGRGHEGDSPGQAIVTGIALHSAVNGSHECATYGCPLMVKAHQTN